jgi:4-aminobutyrate aminotransferase
MVAVEFARADGTPDGARAKQVLHHCVDHGLLLLTCGPYDQTLRLIPPLIVTADQVRDGLAILGDAIEECS